MLPIRPSAFDNAIMLMVLLTMVEQNLSTRLFSKCTDLPRSTPGSVALGP